MSVSDADNRNHPVEYALPAHADTNPVIGTDTRPAAHDDENPFATVADPYCVPAPGWFDHRNDVGVAMSDVECT